MEGEGPDLRPNEIKGKEKVVVERLRNEASGSRVSQETRDELSNEISRLTLNEANSFRAAQETRDEVSNRVSEIPLTLRDILDRPRIYIGSVKPEESKMWVLDEEDCMKYKSVTIRTGLLTIFDSILVNAANYKTQDAKMNTLMIDINEKENVISIGNNGAPIEKDKVAFIFDNIIRAKESDSELVKRGRLGSGAKVSDNLAVQSWAN